MNTRNGNVVRALAAAAVLVVGAGAAHAGGRVNWSLSIGLPLVVGSIGNGGVVYAGPPVYAAPPVVYAPPAVVYAPPAVVYGPPSVVYAPAPVIYTQRIVRPVPWRDDGYRDDRRGWKQKHGRWHDDD